MAQRADLTKPTLFFGLSSSDAATRLADHFAFRALNGAGTNRRISALADIVPCRVSSVPSLLRSGDLRVDVVLIQVKLLPTGGFTLGVIADSTQALIHGARGDRARQSLPPGDARRCLVTAGHQYPGRK